jgi:hypothetical protein
MGDQTVPTGKLSDARRNPPEGEWNAEARSTLRGARAHEVISSRFRGYPAAQLLAREVYGFYDNCLSYLESTDLASTVYVIALEHFPVALKNVEIRLQLGTGRVAQALGHELLHLHLPMLGYPLGEFVEIPFQLDPYAQTFLGMCRWVVNIVQHEINFEKFLTLGFQEKHFLAELTRPMNDGEGFNLISQDRFPREVDFSRWCIEYVKYLFTARHGGSKNYLRYAQDVLDQGSQQHRDLRDTARRIDEWLETGAFRDPCQYPQQVNLLLELMKVPGFTSWVVLKPSEHIKPIALRLQTDDS